MSFGYGDAVCPDCFTGESSFIFLDRSYWLNRLISRVSRVDESDDISNEPYDGAIQEVEFNYPIDSIN